MTFPTDAAITARANLHRYTITSKGASLGYYRLVEDPNGVWMQTAEVEAALCAVRDETTEKCAPYMQHRPKCERSGKLIDGVTYPRHDNGGSCTCGLGAMIEAYGQRKAGGGGAG